jgi:hypothetical protein
MAEHLIAPLTPCAPAGHVLDDRTAAIARVARSQLATIVGCLGDLEWTGVVRVSCGPRLGEIALLDGRVIAACIGSEIGVAALQTMLTALPNGTFALEPNAHLGAGELVAHVEEFSAESARIAAAMPSLDAVPVRTELEAATDAMDDVVLSRVDLRVLAGLNGQQTVGDLMRQYGASPTLLALVHLMDKGLVHLDCVVAPRQPVPSAWVRHQCRGLRKRFVAVTGEVFSLVVLGQIPAAVLLVLTVLTSPR